MKPTLHLLAAIGLSAACLSACAPVDVGGDTDAPVGVGDGSDGADGTDGVDGTDGADGTDGSDGGDGDDSFLFDADQVVDIEIFMPEADWFALRNQTRSIFDAIAGDCMNPDGEAPFTWFEAEVRIDGETLEQVAIRKKGFIGSLNPYKPGIKLDFDRYVDDRRFHGLERLTLNNTPQDPTMVRTCLALEYFRAAGVPGSRCGFAHVTVNGEDLGIYANVEAVDDHFLERLTGSDDVPVFEGTLSDLREGWLGTYDPDSDAADPDLLPPLMAAVETGDLPTIEAVFDLDAFLRFWAAEVMVGQWDGYTWNANNHFLYQDPADGRWAFLPWGPDAAWTWSTPGGGLDWVAVSTALPRALVLAPGGEDRYRAELQRQLDDVWDGTAMADRAAQMVETIRPYQRIQADELAWLQSLIRGQRRVMEGGLSGGSPTWSAWPMDRTLCMSERGRIALSFESTWGSAAGTTSPGTCTVDATWDGAPWALTGGAYTGQEGDRAVSYCWTTLGAGELLPHFSTPDYRFVEGSLPTQGTLDYGNLYYRDAGTGWNWSTISWMEGTLQIDAVGQNVGDPVRFSYEGILWNPAW